MLTIKIPSVELFDEENQLFIFTKEQVLQLEHSLVSLSKWESKFCTPFITKETKSNEQTIEYIKCMTLTQNVNDDVYKYINNDILTQVRNYIEADMTATTFSNEKKSTDREIITAEIIYYWMIALNIPFECQKWHLNRLITLINVCNKKNAPPKKMSKKEVLSRNAQLNAARKKALNSQG